MCNAANGNGGCMLNVVVANDATTAGVTDSVNSPSVLHINDEFPKIPAALSATSNTVVNKGSDTSSSALGLRETSEMVHREGRKEEETSEFSITTIPNVGGGGVSRILQHL